jgi:predicted glutamine amidotransferase
VCQVQIIKRFGKNAKLDSNDIKAFFKLLEYGSYSNNDAFGFFGKNYMFRKAGAFHEEKPNTVGGLTKAIMDKETSFLVGHNRLATKGDEKKNFNNHPFPTKDWIIVHNGVLHNDEEICKTHGLDYKAETDSAVVVHLLQKLYEEKNDSLEAIKTVAESLSGSFSICVYNKTEDRLFYFKNKSTNFSFRLFVMNDGSEVLVGSTDEDNLDRIYTDSYMIFHNPLYQTYYHTISASGMIYEITDKDIRMICPFKEAEYSYSNYHGTRYDTKTGTSSKEYKTTGGIYDTDWENKDWQNARDIDYSNRNGELVEWDDMDKREDIQEFTELLVQEVDEKTGLDWEYEIDWKNCLVIMKTEDNPISYKELHRTVQEALNITIEHQTGKNGGCLLVPFDEIIETYK